MNSQRYASEPSRVTYLDFEQTMRAQWYATITKVQSVNTIRFRQMRVVTHLKPINHLNLITKTIHNATIAKVTS